MGHLDDLVSRPFSQISCMFDTTSLTIKGTDSSKLMDKVALIANDEPELTEGKIDHDIVTDKETKYGGYEDDEIVK